jgi:hypothetical protein
MPVAEGHVQIFQKLTLKSFQGIPKVTVAREGFGEPFILHHDEGNTVGERPVLVSPAGE